MTKYKGLFLVLLLGSFSALAQEVITGQVVQGDTIPKKIGLEGASVYWLNSPIGTVTDRKGKFTIPYRSEFNRLVISFVGFQSDTLTVTEPIPVLHTLKRLGELEEVVVEKKREAAQKSFLAPQNKVVLNSTELLKAACCNLSESFETNPSIDVNFNDALTGTKQIQMLGLTSPYLLITQENIPMVRGASQTYGLTFTPGTWVESIQITKGAGSVVNGYESISGQINTELVKPLTDVPLFVNGYANLNGRMEVNTHINTKVSDKWHTGFYLHGNQRLAVVDNNNDGFLDVPLVHQLNLQNRWQYQDAEKGWVSFLNFRYLNDEKQLGQLAFNPDTDKFTANVWGGEIDTQRFDASMKLGYVFPQLPFQSIGFQSAFSNHQQASYYGLNRYDIDHQSWYSNLLFNSIIGSTQHQFKAGLTMAYDRYEELVNNINFERTDYSAGGFFEYSYNNLERISLSAGLRFDTHNRLGNFITPRFHIRYTPWERGSLRGSFGIGRRAANIFAENQQFFASARRLRLLDNEGPIYGFEAEQALNFGISFLQGFTLFGRPGNFSVDWYRTQFDNQVVVDWENPREIVFSNLNGDSYANSLMIELNHEVLPQLALRTAYKWYDVKTEYQTGLLQRPLVAENRFFVNLAYETVLSDSGGQWRFDATFNRVGEQRLPSTDANPIPLQLGDFVEGYNLINTQITKVFSKKWEVYLGGENLTASRQPNPILSAMDPFSTNFDTSIVYAPILGRMFYVGFRFKS
ncbi:MAG: TonB-dependent receptor [Bacteroidota bacterium]